jgi:hypothetical protein
MTLSEQERKALAALADVLIPAGADLPSASAADVAGKWLDQVLAACPDLAAGLRELLHKTAGQEPGAAVAALRATDTAAFSVLAEVVAGAYFLNPDVRRAIGYSGQTARPIDPRPDYMEDGLLESVIRRGPIYRPTPAPTDAPGPGPGAGRHR